MIKSEDQKMMRVYLAGSSNELALCESFMHRLRECGRRVTHDWVADIREVGEANPREASEADRAKWARCDLQGVYDADVVWLLVPQVGGKGCWAEFGYALGLARVYEKTLIVSGDYRCSIFTALADHVYDTHEEAFALIRDRN